MPVRNGKPNHKSPVPNKPARTLQTNSLPFQDHCSNNAYMVFYSYIHYPLPPLFVFLVYFTHSDASSDDLNQKALLRALENNYTRFRLELFFLPGATDEECMNHYHSEKAARGDYRAQVVAVEESDPDQDFDESCACLPGLVPSYTSSAEMNSHHSLLFICPQKDWTDGEQTMCMVEFDPMSEEEYEALWDPGEPARPPEKCVSVLPIYERSPLVGSRTVRGQMMASSLFDFEEVTAEPWHEASERGWTSW